MDGFGDQPLSLRGPSLPGSLGVRVRGDWESFEEEHEGISMRSNGGEDANVQLDCMKEVERYVINDIGDFVGQHGILETGNDGGEGRNIQREFIKYEMDGVNGGENQETFKTQLEEVLRNEGDQDANVELDLQAFHPEERDIDETGRKFLRPMQTNTLSHSDSRNCPENRVLVDDIHDLPGRTPSFPWQSHSRNDATESCISPRYTQVVKQSTQSKTGDDNFSINSLYSLAERSNPDSTRPLPGGKRYHVFFSYEMADRDWVHSVVEKMESDHGYRCSFHERDFHGGKRVIENIDEHIQWSVKTVLVLSPDFLESSWCQFEMKQGLHASIEEARMLILPVMVRECEVPDTLRSLTYIDATPGADWWDRFLEAVDAQDSLLICNAERNQVSIQPRFENLDVLCELPSIFHCMFGERLDVPYTPEALSKPGLEVPNDEFHIAISLLRTAQSTFCINRYLCDYIPACAPLFVIYCLGVVACIITGRTFLGGYQDPNDPSAWKLLPEACVLFTVPLLFFVLFIVFYFLQLKLRARIIRRAAVKVNRRLLLYRILTGVCISTLGHCSSLKMKVIFYFFDVQQCKEHLKDALSRLDPAMVDEQLSEEYTESLIVNFSEEYTRDYQEGKLRYQVGFVTRHVRHVKCLCQYVEDLLKEQQNWRLFCEKRLKLVPKELV